ncbi:MAG: exodeoxyribonuclease V subunit alpha [Deltaproteobacteria bacterium]|nr:exodeoxyribonuclease V subunit alpha [Candidatus Tharpella sp.]
MEKKKMAGGGDSEKIAFLESLSTPGPFHYIDIYFARLVCRLAGDRDSWPLFLAALLASYVVNSRRQICLPLRDLADSFSEWLQADNGSEIKAENAARLASLKWPTEWEAELAGHIAVANPENAALRRHLLVLDDGRLYLQRYWDYEQRLARMINERLKAPIFAFPEPVKSLSVVAPRFAGEKCAAHDGDTTCDTRSFNFQAAAVCAGLRNRFTIISGGPGCGKTSVVAAVAALWLEYRPQARIVLCAPTGLAQARLHQALLDEVDFLNCSDKVREELLKLSVATIHRLLGYRPGAGFRYHAENLLPVDLLIVDEASMVPLWIMTSLFAALPKACAVILLGDKNQLASVEAGAVLGDLCSLGFENRFSSDFQKDFVRLTMASSHKLPETPEKTLLGDHIVELKRSYRFTPDGGIARLQRAIMVPASAADSDLEQLCTNDPSGEVGIRLLPTENPAFDAFLLSELTSQEVEVDGRMVALKSYTEVDDLASAFAIFQRFRLLSPLRRGRFGVENLNRLMPRALGLQASRQYYKGRPLMITRNAPQLNLYNGDTGLVWPDSEGRLRAWFRHSDGSFADYPPLRLPSHESAFAVTVHKAQGSGFQKVVLLWPAHENALLTREMLYTAVTRAAKRIEIWLPKATGQASCAAPLAAACRHRVDRFSGLLKTLQGLDETKIY